MKRLVSKLKLKFRDTIFQNLDKCYLLIELSTIQTPQLFWKFSSKYDVHIDASYMSS
jgi:hypothetical protein